MEWGGNKLECVHSATLIAQYKYHTVLSLHISYHICHIYDMYDIYHIYIIHIYISYHTIYISLHIYHSIYKYHTLTLRLLYDIYTVLIVRYGYTMFFFLLVIDCCHTMLCFTKYEY